MTTREHLFTAVAALNAKIAELKCAGLINGAKYGHEIDNGYGKLATAADVIKPLAKQVHWLRHEARTTCQFDGAYIWGIRLCADASALVGLIDNIERRA